MRKAHAPPSVDEKLGEEEGAVKEKNDAMATCRKYIGQMMWLTTRTRPDIAACLGILASLMVRRPKEVKNYLVCLWRCLWRYLWTTKTMPCAHCPPGRPKPQNPLRGQEDSQVTLTQLRNESVTTRSRPFANKFIYARDTSTQPASVKAVFEAGKSQKADGLTKVLAGASMKTFVSDLGLAPLTR